MNLQSPGSSEPPKAVESQLLVCSFFLFLLPPATSPLLLPAALPETWHTGLQTPRPHTCALTSYRQLLLVTLGLGVPTAQPGKSKVSGNCSRRGKGMRFQAGISHYPQWSSADLEGHSWKRAQSTGTRSTGPRQGPGRAHLVHFQGQFCFCRSGPSGQKPDLWRGSQMTKGGLIKFSRVKHESERETDYWNNLP